MPEIIIAQQNYHLPSNSRPVQKLKRGAIFLDRDGVIVEEVGYIGSPEKLKILPGVPDAIRSLQQRFRTIVITNQSGIGRGLFSEEDLLKVHSEMVRSLSEQGAILDGIYYCPHSPDVPVHESNRVCDCRKPGSGMLVRAAADWNIDLTKSYMVGDRASDMEAARSVGAVGIMIAGDDSHGPATSLEATKKATSLAEAARWMLADPG